jgi:hypothetical protein
MDRERIIHFSLRGEPRRRLVSAIVNFGEQAGHTVVQSATSVQELERTLEETPHTLILINRKDLEAKDAVRIEEMTKDRRVVVYSSDKKILPSDFIKFLTELQP